MMMMMMADCPAVSFGRERILGERSEATRGGGAAPQAARGSGHGSDGEVSARYHILYYITILIPLTLSITITITML